MCKMVRMHADLAEHVVIRDTAREMLCTLTGVRFRALAAPDSGGQVERSGTLRSRSIRLTTNWQDLFISPLSSTGTTRRPSTAPPYDNPPLYPF
jgi:hypothetical protein